MNPKQKVRYGLVVRIPGSHPGGPGSIPGNGKLFERLSSQIAFLSLCVPWMPSRQARTRKKNIASAGNRTRINCLEGSYADHYTTDAVLIVLLPKSQVFQQILPVLCPWARRSTCSSLGDIAQWQSNRLQSDRSMVQIRVSPIHFLPAVAVTEGATQQGPLQLSGRALVL